LFYTKQQPQHNCARTILVEHVAGELARRGDFARDGAQKLDDKGHMVFVAVVVLSRVRLEQKLARGQLKRLSQPKKLLSGCRSSSKPKKQKQKQNKNTRRSTMQATLQMSADVLYSAPMSTSSER
jgi:hypothetical protein